MSRSLSSWCALNERAELINRDRPLNPQHPPHLMPTKQAGRCAGVWLGTSKLTQKSIARVMITPTLASNPCTTFPNEPPHPSSALHTASSPAINRALTPHTAPSRNSENASSVHPPLASPHYLLPYSVPWCSAVTPAMATTRERTVPHTERSALNTRTRPTAIRGRWAVLRMPTCGVEG
jgi:hypothetical protein